jgi:cell division septation protein DedD
VKRTSSAFPSRSAAGVCLGILVLCSLSCTAVTSRWAAPSPTVTPSPTPTTTPTATNTPTRTPSPTPEGLLAADARAEYLVILRYTNQEVRSRFQKIQAFLIDQGYQVEIDAGQSVVGDMDIILFGALSCKDAVDDLIILLEGRLDIDGLERVRFKAGDASYEKQNIVIQIRSIELFGPHE